MGDLKKNAPQTDDFEDEVLPMFKITLLLVGYSFSVHV